MFKHLYPGGTGFLQRSMKPAKASEVAPTRRIVGHLMEILDRAQVGSDAQGHLGSPQETGRDLDAN